jgi:hypothetical protein
LGLFNIEIPYLDLAYCSFLFLNILVSLTFTFNPVFRVSASSFCNFLCIWFLFSTLFRFCYRYLFHYPQDRRPQDRMLYFALRSFRSLINDYIFFIHKTAIKKKKQFYSYPPPLSFSVLSLPFIPQSYFELVRLYSLSHSEFFYSFSCFFVLYSVIYHCFPPCYLYRSISLLRPLVCSRSIPPIYFLRSIHSVSSPLHFPSCLWGFFSNPPSPLPNFLLLFLAYMNISFHASFFFSIFLSLFFNP